MNPPPMSFAEAVKETWMFRRLNPARRRIKSALAPAIHLCRRLDAALFLSLHHRRRTSPLARRPALIVSLTSFEPRLDTLHICLASLFRQSIAPDRIVLWLGEGCHAQVMNGTDRVARRLQRFQGLGLEIRACKDIRSYKKIIPALKAFPDSLVVTADDDKVYPARWLEELYIAYQGEPRHIHCHSACEMRWDAQGKLLPYAQWDTALKGRLTPAADIFPVGSSGVLYAPGHLDGEVFNEDVFMDICPLADDIWLKAMSLRAGVLCQKIHSRRGRIKPIHMSSPIALKCENVLKGGNDVQLRAVDARYHVFHPVRDRHPVA